MRAGLVLALVSCGCAPSLWNSRFFGCDDLESIDLVGGTFVVEDGDGGDCSVQVRNLSELDVNGGRLSGNDFDVLATGRIAYDFDVVDTEFSVALDELAVDTEPGGSFTWSDDEQHLVVATASPLFVSGRLTRLTVVGEGPQASLDAPLTAVGELEVFGVTEADVSVLEGFDAVDLEATVEVSLTIPAGEYALELTDSDDAGRDEDITIAPQIQHAATATSAVEITAPSIEITTEFE